jgi:hypothetical protein
MASWAWQCEDRSTPPPPQQQQQQPQISDLPSLVNKRLFIHLAGRRRQVGSFARPHSQFVCWQALFLSAVAELSLRENPSIHFNFLM